MCMRCGGKGYVVDVEVVAGSWYVRRSKLAWKEAVAKLKT